MTFTNKLDVFSVSLRNIMFYIHVVGPLVFPIVYYIIIVRPGCPCNRHRCQVTDTWNPYEFFSDELLWPLMGELYGEDFFPFVLQFFGKLFICRFTKISLIFISLTYVVFLLVWGYGYYMGLTRIEVYIYILIELISYVLFMVYDFFYFIVLLELITVLLLLTYEGAPDRGIKAMSLLFFYTITSGSFLLFIYLLRETGFFSSNNTVEVGIIIIMIIGIFIKLPIFPVHYWLPEAHAEATTCGSLILAGIVLKIGFYGFIEFISYELLSSIYCSMIVILLFISGCYLSCCLMVQSDIKKIIAYSSVVHMHVALAVYLVGGLYSLESCLYLVLNHGLVSSGLFFCAGIYIDLEGTRDILCWKSPSSSQNLGLIMLILILSNMGFPLTIGFWGEFYGNYVMLGCSVFYIALFLLNQILIVIYNLRLFWLVYSTGGLYIYVTDGRVYSMSMLLSSLVACNLLVFLLV